MRLFLLLITFFNIQVLKTPSNILFLARWYPDRYDPMPGLFIQRHAEVAAGFARVAILYLRAVPGNQERYQIEQTIVNKVVTVRVYYRVCRSQRNIFTKIVSSFRFVMAFFKGYRYLLKSWGKPDILHVNVLTRLGMPALWLRVFHGISYVITEHWSRYLPITGTYKGLLRKVFTRLVVKHAAAISTVSLNLSNAMQQHGLQNAHYLVLPNVVDFELFKPSKEPIARKKKRFIHVSCFEDRSKNISGLLRVIGKLVQGRSDVECILVGEGIDLDNMRKYALQLSLKEPEVQFMGLLEDERLAEAYQGADFMVMFSNYENMPVVIGESFACGLPVVATSVGGIPEYVNDTNGRLVEARDENALFRAISFMLDHHQDFNKSLIRDSAIEIFGKQSIIGKLKELYGFVPHD